MRHYLPPLLVTFFISSLMIGGSGFAQDEQGEKVYRSAFRACTVLSSLSTTCAHRLDASVMQPLAAVTWTANELQPLLAESWETEDGKVWTLNLREGVTWHDGEPFTAEDVVFSFNAYANPAVASRWSSKVGGVEGYDAFQSGEADALSGVEAVDDSAVRVTLAEPNPNWMLLEQSYIVIFPEHILGDVPPEELANHPFWTDRVGTGPFKWDLYVPGQTVEVVRNDDYFLGAPELDRIIYTNFADAAALLAAIERGEIDELPYESSVLPVTDIERYDNLDGVTVVPMNSGAPIYLRLSYEVPELADPLVRQAMAHAIDRDAIIEGVFEGQTEIRNSLFTQDWATAEDLNPYPYDPERARELLEEAGFDASRTFDFVYYYSDPLTQDVVTAIQAYLAEVGINVAPRLVNGATLNQMYRDGSFEIGYVALGHGLDPAAAAPAVECGSLIALGYCNEEVDALFAEGITYADQDERAPVYQEISRILNEDLAGIFLWQQIRPLAFRDSTVGPIEHWQEQPVILFNLPYYAEIENWDVGE